MAVEFHKIFKETNESVSRRTLLKGAAAGVLLEADGSHIALAQDLTAEPSSRHPVRWISTTETRPWKQERDSLDVITPKDIADYHVVLQPNRQFQVIEGFGGCFHELGWLALQRLDANLREDVLNELFAMGTGADFNFCRIPIGANDYARNWYSHAEVPGDFSMSAFNIARDRELLIPFIKAARRRRGNMKLWASPWSPPTWMKTNGHYAQAQPFASFPDNGLKADQVVGEGEDGFIQKEAYFKAYALYFRRFVEAYQALGLPITAVVPQNEFNSAQVFPSCCWSPEGLARFIPYLGKEMQAAGVDVWFGTLERSDDSLFEKVNGMPDVAPFITGIAAQWAGRGAVPFIHHAHPQLKVIQSEQECGTGTNDWRFARYTWSMMKDFLHAGASIYDYWNLVTPLGGLSTWGWPQNSLISVDPRSGTFTYNPDYYVLKHLSHFVHPGARRIGTSSISGYDNLLAFQNPDGKLVVIIQNELGRPMPVHLAMGGFNGPTYRADLPADSFNTIAIL